MKLVEKKELEKSKLLEQQIEIDRGLKLAQRVDEIREKKVKEEQDLEKWRTETIRIVQGMIDELLAKKENISSEILILEQKRAEALIPLDHEKKEAQRMSEESARVLEDARSQESAAHEREKRAKEQLDSKESDLLSQEHSLVVRGKSLDEREREIEAQEELLAERRASLDIVSETFYSDKEQKEGEWREKDVAMSYREVDVNSRYNAALRKETENRDKERELISRYTSLEEAIVEMKKKYPNLTL